MTKKKPTKSEAIARLNDLTSSNQLATIQQMPAFERAIALSDAMGELRAAMEPVLPSLLPLAGSGLGFAVDKKYKPEEIRDGLVEAALRGALPVGNEFAIISGKPYMQKAFFERVLPPLVKDLVLHPPAIVEQKNNTAHVTYQATWKVGAHEDSIHFDAKAPLLIKVNAGMGADAIFGKAERKLLAAVYKKVTGYSTPDTDDLASDDVVVEAAVIHEEEEVPGDSPETITFAQVEELEEIAMSNGWSLKAIRAKAKMLFDTNDLAKLPPEALKPMMEWAHEGPKK